MATEETTAEVRDELTGETIWPATDAARSPGLVKVSRLGTKGRARYRFAHVEDTRRERHRR